jgi:hypothetical protein
MSKVRSNVRPKVRRGWRLLRRGEVVGLSDQVSVPSGYWVHPVSSCGRRVWRKDGSFLHPCDDQPTWAIRKRSRGTKYHVTMTMSL